MRAADLCLECGEPVGDSPAARVARADQRPPPPAPHAPPSASDGPPPSARVRAANRASRATIPAGPGALRRRVEEPEAVRCPGCGLSVKSDRCHGCGAPVRRS
jgi:hypothetical protein